MAIVVAHHKVRDYKVWKPYYDGDLQRRRNAGLTDLAVGQRQDDPNDVVMIWRSSDPKKLESMANDPSLKDLMQKAGVTGPFEILHMLSE